MLNKTVNLNKIEGTGKNKSNQLFDELTSLLKSIPRGSTDLNQRLVNEVFPKMYNCSEDLVADVFRCIERNYGLGKREKAALEKVFIHNKDQYRLNCPAGAKMDVIDPLISKKAMERLKSPEFFDLLIKDLRTIGLVGEKENSLIIYIIAQSVKMADPLHLVIFGVSSGGKSSLVKKILDLLPDRAKLILASVSGRAFEYLDESLTRDRVVFIEEFEGLNATLPTLRLILSEHNATRAVVQQDPQTDSFTTVISQAKHKFGLMTTTTREFIENETATRLFCLYIDQKRSHIKDVGMHIRKRHTMEYKSQRKVRENIMRLHRTIHCLLHGVEVDIPFAQLIDFPSIQARHSRDLEKFLCLIEAIAFIRQYQKDVKYRDGQGYIQADIEDYRIAYELIPYALAEGFQKLPEAEETVLRIIIRFVKNNRKFNDIHNPVHITTRVVLDEALNADIDVGEQTKVGQILKSLEYRGFLSSISSHRQGSRSHYTLAEDITLNDTGEIKGLRPELLNKVLTPEKLQAKINGIDIIEEENMETEDENSLMQTQSPENDKPVAPDISSDQENQNDKILAIPVKDTCVDISDFDFPDLPSAEITQQTFDPDKSSSTSSV